MILARLDISKKIGTGHFRRINNLANYMSPIKFIFLVISDNKKNLILGNQQIFFTSKKNEYRDMCSILSKYDIDTIILDLLHYEEGYIKKIKKMTGKKIASFHEYDDTSKYSDLKINYNFFNGFEDVKDPKFLAGYKYIIFDCEIKNYKMSIDKDYVFVSFGGSDPSEFTEIFIEKVANKLSSIKFLVHVGNLNLLNINKISLFENVKVISKPENLFKYMAGAKLAIVSGGNIMYELMYLSIPSLVIAHNKHQEMFAMNASKYGCVNYFGLCDDVSYLALINNIQNKISNYNNECKINIDSNGNKRIMKSLLDLSLQ